MTGSLKRQKKNSPQSSKSYYPIYLDLKGKKCFVIGGGKVAERKCLSLVKNGADVTVISPSTTKRLETFIKKGKIKHIPRLYKRGDIKSAFLVIAATDSQEINRRIHAEVRNRNILLNVVDSPELCNFIVPSVFTRGDLKIAISTGGTSPAIAKRIRKELEVLYNTEFSRYLGFLKEIRSQIKEGIENRGNREDLLNYLASNEVLNLLRKKGFKVAREKIIHALSNRL